MFKLSPKGSKIKCYGYIVNAKTAHIEQKREGYIINIKTTITLIDNKEKIPIYIQFFERKGRELYEWFIRNDRKSAPVYIEGRKKEQRFGKTTRMKYENAERILWIFLYSNSKIIPLPNGIPEQYKNLKL